MSLETKESGGAKFPHVHFLTPEAIASISGTKWARGIMEHVPHEETSDASAADILVLTDMTTNNHQYNTQAIKKLRQHTKKKPLIVFLHDDPEWPMDLPDTKKMILFRNSLDRSTHQPYERMMPSFQACDNGIEMLPPATCDVPWKPKIGFCGVGKWPSRKSVCEALSAKKHLFDTRFVFRDDHHTRVSSEQQQINKQEFETILRDCPYQLAGRGAGNWSHRFYEVLAAGRIPVLIDTDSVWPIKHVPISLWNRCVVIAPNAESLPAALLHFHTDNDVAVTQVLCRHLWEAYFSLEGFAAQVEEAISELI
jgi:hypothetical protein